MKSCPKCNRTFPDEGQKFCTFDGGLLISPQAFDPNATIRATAAEVTQMSEEKTTSRELPDLTETMVESSFAATVALPRNTGPTEGALNTGELNKPTPAQTPPPTPPPLTPTPPQPQQQQQQRVSQAPLPPPPQQQQRVSQSPLPPPPQVATPVGVSAPLPKQKSKLPWIIAGVLMILLLGGGALAGLFFFVIKPRLDESANRQTNNQPVVTDTNRNAPVSTPTPEAKPSEAVDKYVPPPNTVQFVNSKANLDGRLAEHYLDFSFYYPNSWKKDPKAGVPGASNFVLVERSVSNFPQENFAVGWYTSSGTFVGDLPNYPKRVEEFSSALAKQFPEYRKVSDGPTKINSMDAYEFRWEGLSKGTEKGDVHLWGRVVFLPSGNEGDTTGATLTMFTTSLASELSGVEDVGVKGQMPVILESFRFGNTKRN